MGKLFTELKEMKSAYDRKLKEEGEAAVKDAFKDVFDKFPEIRSIMWTQYTPYFNDGDQCYFSVREFDVNVGTDEDIQKQIEKTKVAVKAAADAGDYRKAQSLSSRADELTDKLNDKSEYQYGESLYTLKRSNNPREVEAAEAIRLLQKELPDDVMEAVFGDHCRIKATREGFDVEEYSHD